MGIKPSSLNCLNCTFTLLVVKGVSSANTWQQQQQQQAAGSRQERASTPCNQQCHMLVLW
jgi:hypothetical protein